MEIRSAVHSDIPNIVSLLKFSLGESLMPKSEEFWRWKHVDNPFGKSFVILAFEKNEVIGVRAFMRWEWRRDETIYQAVRAVDTATHPHHQGKGIFKKLTLQLVEQCRHEGIHFIFNTPNNSSKPGYLKMGWRSNGKMKLSMRPVFNFRSKQPDFDLSYGLSKESRIDNALAINRQAIVSTSVTSEFLRWRYITNPNIKYYSFSDKPVNPTYTVYFRLKPFKFGTEFRICDAFFSQQASKSKFRKQLQTVVEASGARIISSAHDVGLFPSFSLTIGPEITTRTLSIEDNLLSFNNWKPSLGDMEVF